jgi:hypothetical protein
MLTDRLPRDAATRLTHFVHEAQVRLGSQPEAAALFARATTAFMRELLGMSEALGAAGRDLDLLAQDDQTLLAELMMRALRTDPLASKETRLRLRGQLALHQLLERAGGVYTATEVAALLGITPDAVRKRAARGKLLVVPQGEHGVYPAFQFDADANRSVTGLDAVLALLDTASAPAKVRFFLTPDRDLDAVTGATPIAALRAGDPALGALVARKARQFGIAETFGHDVSEHYPPATDKFVTVTELTERHLYRIKTNAALRVGLLQGAGLAALNLDVRLLATVDYALPQRWSRWVYDAPAALDGILYPSRLLPDHENTALFNRCRDRLEEEDLGTLAQWRCSETGQDILDILDARGWGLV